MSFVYFIETADQQFVKIGFSTRIFRRFSDLGTLRPANFALRLIGVMPGTMQTERWIHSKFCTFRDNGEWFRRTPEIQAFMDAVGLIQPKDAPVAPTASPSDDGLEPTPNRCKVRRAETPCEENAVAPVELNGAAVALGRLGGKARKRKLTPEHRKEIARRGGLAGGRGRPKK